MLKKVVCLVLFLYFNYFFVYSFSNIIYGTEGNDNLYTNSYKKIYAKGGDDIIKVDGKSNTIDAGNGNDKVYINGNAYKTIYLGNGNNFLNIKKNTKKIYTKGGNDIIYIYGDLLRNISGEGGNDIIFVNKNSKGIYGENGNDIIYVSGNNYGELLGGDGNDFIFAGGKSYRGIYAGDGNDIICVSNNFNYVEGEGGYDIVYVNKGLNSWQYRKIKAEKIIKVNNIRKIKECKLNYNKIFYEPASITADDLLIGESGKLSYDGTDKVVESLLSYGNVVSGNRIKLDAGTYKADFYIKATNLSKNGSLLNIGVFSWDSNQEGYYREIFSKDFSNTSNYQKLSFKFKVDRNGIIISPYVYTPGLIKFYIKKIDIYKINEILDYSLSDNTLYNYEESSLYKRIGNLVNDTDADNGKAFLANITDGIGFLSFGPYSEDELPGNHRIKFRLKTDDIGNKNILARIEVFDVNGNGVNKIRYIKGSDFSYVNKYQDFYIDYNVPSNSKLEFRVLYFPTGKLYLDNIKVLGPRIDKTPAKISNINLSSYNLNSFDLLNISFEINKDLLDKPEVKVGDYSARFEKKVGNTYYYTYKVNDHVDSQVVVNKKLTISAIDLNNNVILDNSKSISLNLTNTGYIYEVEDLPNNVGTEIKDLNASWNKARFVNGNNKGYLSFGPYDDILPANKFYIAKFRLKTSDNTNSSIIATIDVVNTNGNSPRVSKSIKGTDFSKNNEYQEFTLKFYKGDSGVEEYRIYFEGNGNITADKVSIYPYIDSVSEQTYESEDLYYVVGNEVNDPFASNGKAIYAKSGSDDAGSIQFGPYTTNLKNGIWYEAKFRLKTNNITNTNPIGLIDVYDSESGYRVFKEIRGIDFTGTNIYQDISIRFLKPNTNNLEFRVFFYGNQDLWADKVIVKEDISSKLPSYESEDLPSSVGSIIYDTNASGNQARKFTILTDSAGTLQFGPYDATNLVNGAYYKAVFRMKVPNNSMTDYIALIDVYNGDTGYRKIKEIRGIDFTGNNVYQDFEIIFQKPTGSDNMEYRVFAYGNSDIIVDKVDIYAVDPSTLGVLPTYESEDLPTKIGYTVVDNLASSSKALTYNVASNPDGGTLQFGPYQVDNVDIGSNYNANFVLKVPDNTSNSIIAYLNVYDYKTNLNLTLPIKGSDFNTANSYQTFKIPFTLDDNTALEFRIFVTGNIQVFADKVYLSK